jgi:hypothetical protein
MEVAEGAARSVGAQTLAGGDEQLDAIDVR